MIVALHLSDEHVSYLLYTCLPQLHLCRISGIFHLEHSRSFPKIIILWCLGALGCTDVCQQIAMKPRCHAAKTRDLPPSSPRAWPVKSPTRPTLLRTLSALCPDTACFLPCTSPFTLEIGTQALSDTRRQSVLLGTMTTFRHGTSTASWHGLVLLILKRVQIKPNVSAYR